MNFASGRYDSHFWMGLWFGAKRKNFLFSHEIHVFARKLTRLLHLPGFASSWASTEYVIKYKDKSGEKFLRRLAARITEWSVSAAHSLLGGGKTFSKLFWWISSKLYRNVECSLNPFPLGRHTIHGNITLQNTTKIATKMVKGWQMITDIQSKILPLFCSWPGIASKHYLQDLQMLIESIWPGWSFANLD